MSGECRHHECPIHTGEETCRLIAGVDPGELRSFVRYCLEARETSSQVPCDLWKRALYPRLSKLRWKSDDEDRELEALSDLFLICERIDRSRRGDPVTFDYLIRSARNWSVDRRRSETGRMRCGSCSHFLRSSSLCSRPGSPYDSNLTSTQDPRKLQPSCGEFHAIRESSIEEPLPSPGSASSEKVERVSRGLEVLRQLDPEQWRLLHGHAIDQQTIKDLSREVGCDVRVARTRLEGARRALQRIVEDLP